MAESCSKVITISPMSSLWHFIQVTCTYVHMYQHPGQEQGTVVTTEWVDFLSTCWFGTGLTGRLHKQQWQKKPKKLGSYYSCDFGRPKFCIARMMTIIFRDDCFFSRFSLHLTSREMLLSNKCDLTMTQTHFPNWNRDWRWEVRRIQVNTSKDSVALVSLQSWPIFMMLTSVCGAWKNSKYDSMQYSGVRYPGFLLEWIFCWIK